MSTSRIRKLLRRIYINSLLVLGLAILSIVSYNLTAKVVNVSPDSSVSFIYQEFVVQKGDTLWSIAESTNLDMDTRVLVNSIMNYNSMSDAKILPGQVIYVPIAKSDLPDRQGEVVGSIALNP